MDEHTPYPPVLPERSLPRPRLTTLQKAEFIRSVDVFSQATVEELFRLASVAREADFAAQEIIFREDDIADAFYLVAHGQVESVNRTGDFREVAGAGQAVGLYSALTREPRFATAKALEDTFALGVGVEDLLSLLSNNMEIVVGIFKHFTKKLGLNPRT